MQQRNLGKFPSILVISSKRDEHITRVADHLDAAGVDWIRLNTEDFVQNTTVNACPTEGEATLRLHDSGKHLSLSHIKSVWYRKPDPFNLSHFQVESAGLDYIEAELREILDGLYALMTTSSVFWINNPLTTRISHRKLLQLKVATDLGLRTPKTVITNDSTVALDFAEQVGWDLAIKSLGAISVTSHQVAVERQYGIFTRRVNESELRAVIGKIAFMPTLLQEYIPKDYELRITCIGGDVFACKISSQDKDTTRDDFRFEARSLRHEIVNLDDELKARLMAYLQHFNLNCGCFDFAVTPSGEPVFFECNPNGQWLWIEELTDAPISAAVARLLMSQLKQEEVCSMRVGDENLRRLAL